jgi:hypothetical protein
MSNGSKIPSNRLKTTGIILNVGNGLLAEKREQALVLLAEAERLYGPRDATYRFAGVRFDPKGPRIQFSPTCDEIWIELSPSTNTYPDQALHQLAHEVSHLLAPHRSSPGCNVGRGPCCSFQCLCSNIY